MFSAGFVSDFHYNEVKCCAGDTLIYVYTNCNGGNNGCRTNICVSDLEDGTTSSVPSRALASVNIDISVLRAQRT